jgi:hypothetical protein
VNSMLTVVRANGDSSRPTGGGSSRGSRAVAARAVTKASSSPWAAPGICASDLKYLQFGSTKHREGTQVSSGSSQVTKFGLHAVPSAYGFVREMGVIRTSAVSTGQPARRRSWRVGGARPTRGHS